MAQFEQHFVQDLTQQIKVRHCGSIVFNADNESNVVSVRLFNGSEPVAISGSVVGAVVCSDGSTVPLTGSYSGNTASITLTGDCFAVLGQIGVGIQIVNGTQKTTVLKAIYNVETLTTENVVDPGSRITLEVGDLIAAIDEAVATIPEDYSALTSEVADIKSVNKIFNRDVVGVPNPIDTATWIDNANLNDSGAVKAEQGWKVTQGYIETSADSYKISYNNSETSYIVQVAGYTSSGSFVRMFANADSSSGVRSFTIDTTSVDKIRIATRYGNPILSVYPNDGKIVEKLASVEDGVSELKSAVDENSTMTIGAYPINATGGNNVVTIEDGASGVPIKNALVSIAFVQYGAGTPSKTNIRAIGGYTGAVISRTKNNYLPVTAETQTINGITFTVNADMSITANGMASATTVLELSKIAKLPFAESTSLKLSGCLSGSNTTYKMDLVGYYNTSDSIVLATNYDGETIFSCPNQANISHVVPRIVVYSGAVMTNVTFYPMLKYADANNTYDYSVSRRVSFPSEAGVVYGGMLDITNGKLIVDKASVGFSGTWSVANNSGNLVFYKDSAAPLGCRAVSSNMYAANQDALATATVAALNYPKTILTQQVSGTGARFMVYDPEFESLDAFNAFIAANPLQIIYSLATPIVYDVAPVNDLSTLDGTTVFWCDAGITNITYRSNPSVLRDSFGYVTPEMFGAVGDGLADDTQAVLNAIATKQNVKLNGTYVINGHIEPYSNTVLFGTGTLNFNNVSDNADAILILGNNDTTQNRHDITIDGLTIVASTKFCIQAYGEGYTYKPYNIRLKNLTTKSQGSGGVYLNSVHDCIVDGVFNIGGVRAIGTKSPITAPNDCYNITIINCTSANTSSMGYQVYYGSSITIQNCTCDGSMVASEDLSCITIDRAKKVRVIGNNVHDATKHNIFVTGCTDVLVVGNTTSGGEYGIQLAQNNEYYNEDSSILENIGIAVSGNICTEHSTKDIIATGNKCLSLTGNVCHGDIKIMDVTITNGSDSVTTVSEQITITGNVANSIDISAGLSDKVILAGNAITS